MDEHRAKPYIGDQNIINYLRAQGSGIPLHMAKMRIMGAIASPNEKLVPFQVFSSFWPQGEFPQFTHRDESEKFFDVFMGLWQSVEETAKKAEAFLTPLKPISSREEAIQAIVTRLEEIELGFNEGFWGGADDIPMPSASAALIDNLGNEVDAYNNLLQELDLKAGFTPEYGTALKQEIAERDEICVDTVQALLLLKSKSQSEVH